jgi:hypothetical protein
MLGKGLVMAITGVTPEAAAMGFVFLLDVGRWAMEELRERWSFRRDGAKITPVTPEKTLTEAELVTGITPMVQSIYADGDRAEIAHRLRLIDKKRETIRMYEETIAINEQEFLMGRMERAPRDLQERDLKARIRQQMESIRDDLNAIGIEVDSSSLEEGADER